MNIKSTLTAMACLSFFAFAALPEMRITTQNNAEPQSKNGGSCQGAWTAATGTHIFDYITVTNFKLTGSAADLEKSTAKDDSIHIRLRGNSTADAAKKPYRIKFDKKVSLIDKNREPAKSWALLANFYDGTFALNAMAFEMGKRMGLDFTNSSQLVDLYINNQYKGIYQLTEQIQSNKRSVDLRDKHNGWLVEFDYHAPASDECLRAYVVDKNGYNITSFIKAPELDDTPNPKDSTQLRFVKNDLKKLVDKMKESSFPNNGYRDLIDLESFAKYVLIQLVMDNFDFNSKTQTGGLPGSNFLYRIDDCSKIQAGPLWDFDLAAGVQNGGGGGMFPGFPGMGGGGAAGFPSHYQSYQDPVAPTSQNYSHAFYKRLWEDPVFKAKYKKLWDKHKSDFQSMGTYIDNIKSQVSGSVTGKGTNTWANNSMMGSGPLTQDQFDKEVSGFKTWLTNRIGYVDQQLNGIDTSKDVAESAPACSGGGSSSSNATTQPSSSSKQSSSSSAASSGCAYQSSWCDSKPVATTPTAEGSSCFFVSSITKLQGSGIKINGVTPAVNNGNSEFVCGQWSKGDCSSLLPAKQDGGYYIYTGSWVSLENSTFTNGSSNCGNSTPIRPILISQTVTVDAISVMHNAINLQVRSTAKLDIYNLNGKLQKSLNFGSGVYNVSFSDLPKGMYVMQATLGSEKKVQRFVVK